MPLLLKDLKNARVLAACLRGVSPDEIQDIIDKLTELLNEAKEREMQKSAEELQKQQKIDKIIAEMKEDGLSIEDLMERSGVKPSRRMRVRYRFIGVDGVEHTWSGQGRLPKELQKVIDRDHTTKEDYLISDK